MNFVMTDKSQFIEVQGTAEHSPFSKSELLQMMDLAEKGCQDLFKIQSEIVGSFFPLKK
jgi:ribonuclease PH